MRFSILRVLSISGLFLAHLSMHGAEFEVHDVGVEDLNKPLWFTGPILTSSGYVAPPGGINIQPYYSFNTTYQFFGNNWQSLNIPNFYTHSFLLCTSLGIVDKLDFSFTPQVVIQQTKNQLSAGLGDVEFGFGVQLLYATPTDPWPGIKLGLKMIAPLARYRNLNPDKLETDAMGKGSWRPAICLSSSKLWLLPNNHAFEARFAAIYLLATKAHLKGFNYLGGTYNTDAYVIPGYSLFVESAFQYNLTQNWAITCDVVYEHKTRNKVSGFEGSSTSSMPVSLKRPSSENISFAPAIEYNFSKDVGLLAGCWFAAMGRNSPKFANAIVTVNVYF